MKRRQRTTRHFSVEALEKRMLLAAHDDSFEIRQNSYSNPLDVLQNDFFEQNYSGPKRITSTSFGSKGGMIRIGADGHSLEYDAPADGFGTEIFTYYVDHDFSAMVTIKLIAPLAHDHFTIQPNDQAWTLDVIANDPFWDDYDGAKRVSSISETRLGGTVEIVKGGQSIIYTPPMYETGKDAFMYFVDDLYPAEVVINIPDPLRPDKKLDIVWNTENIRLDVLDNDSFWDDYEGERRITHLVETDKAEGSFTIANDGLSVNYTPAEDFQGFETIRYVVDARYEQTITVQVHRPVRDDVFELVVDKNEDEPIVIFPPLENDFLTWIDDRYAPGDTRRNVTVRVVDRITSVGASGIGATVEIAEDGKTIRYAPPVGFRGNDRFEYIANDLHRATIEVTIRDSLPQPEDQGPGGGGGGPRPNPTNYCRTGADTSVANQNSSDNQIDVLLNDFAVGGYRCDPYQGLREITSVSDARNGTVTIAEDRKTIHYTPDEDFVGTDTFQYQVDDIWTETVTIKVIRRVRDDRFRVDPNSTNELEVLPNDLFGADYSGPQRITGVTASRAGASVTISEDRDVVIYAPPAGFSGEDRFTYVVDGGLKAEVTVYVSSSREALLKRFDSASLFGSMMQDAFEQWGELFGTTYETYWGIYRVLTSADGRVHSDTNVQIQGIDEADVIETDDNFLYVVRNDELIIARAWPADDLSIVSRTRIEGTPIGEYLQGDRLTVVSMSNDNGWQAAFDAASTLESQNTSGRQMVDRISVGSPFLRRRPSTVVSVFDVSNRARPMLVQKTKLDGDYVESRRIDDHVFLVLRNDPMTLPAPNTTCEFVADPLPDNDAIRLFTSGQKQICTYETRDAYVARVSRHFDSMLPHYISFNAAGNLVRTGLTITPEDIYQPPDEKARNLISVVSINMSLDEPGLSGARGILTAGADTVFGGQDGLYVLNRGHNDEDGDITRILKFDWNADTGLVDLASFGQVSGFLLNPFSVDSHDGYVRIATTIWNRTAGNHSGNSENTIFVLRDDNGVMEIVGDLQNLGFTEHIKSVRFMGDRAFVTTFREIDPFFVIDLSDPRQPLPVGHVTLPGFNSYMQMIDDNHVMTIGRNAVTETTGATQVVLFDVTDVTRPRIVGRHSFYRDSFSVAELDHHAFGWFAHHNVLAIPLVESRRRRVDSDGDGYPEQWQTYRNDDLALLKVDAEATVESRDGVRLHGQVTNDSAVLRAAFIDNVIYSVAHDSITAVDVDEPSNVLGHGRMDVKDISGSQPSLTHSTGLTRDLVVKVGEKLAQQQEANSSAPIWVAAEIQPNQLDDENWRCTFVFNVGDRTVQVTADAGGEVTAVDDEFDFARKRDQYWTNLEESRDVNGDGIVSPHDVLLLINEINRNGSGALEPVRGVLRQIHTFAESSHFFYDVNDDDVLSPNDVLNLINWLNRTDTHGTV